MSEKNKKKSNTKEKIKNSVLFYSILMYQFDNLWALLNPKNDYDQLKGRCRNLWNSFSSDKQQMIFCRIEEKKKRKEFVDYNPLFAIKKNFEAPRPQTLSYAEYYAKYGTTEEVDGWKMANPTGQKVIYVKTT